jgi:hypothetical protein
MGCDCHFLVERKTSSNNYGGPRDVSEDRNTKIEEIIEGITVAERWVSADEWRFKDGYWIVPYSKEFYSRRNYYLFSILADVRNDGSVYPLDYPRGIPNDCSSGYSYITKQWGGKVHSHSYFTLKELLDVNWDNYKMEYLSDFMKTIEKMKTIDDNPNKVRCVFFFDN